MNWEKALLELANAIKTAAPHLWVIARRQVMVEIFTIGIFAALSLVGIIVLCKVLKWTIKNWREENSSYGKEEWSVYVCLTIAGLFILSIILLVSGESIGARLINPDYYAIKVLTQLVSQ